MSKEIHGPKLNYHDNEQNKIIFLTFPFEIGSFIEKLVHFI